MKSKTLRRAACSALALLLAGFTALPVSGASFFYGETPLDIRMDALEELIEELRENYKDETDLNDIFSGIYKGLFDSFGDPWTEYVTVEPGESNLLTTTIEENYEGVGVVIRKANSGLRVDRVVAGSPAHKAGIRSGDYILTAAGVDVSQMTSSEAAEVIRGAKGSSIEIIVDRDGQIFAYNVIRELISSGTVESKMLREGIGYVKISSFAASTGTEFLESYKNLAASGAASLILDLRGNGGGSVAAAVETADVLIHTEGLISQFKRQGKIIELVRSESDELPRLKTVVLTDRNTASASELLAAALKDNKAAAVVGENTYGKGVAQFVGSAGKDGVFKLSIYYFLSPKGDDIDGKGVAPDVAVYSAGGLSEEERAAAMEGLAPISETTKYYAGMSGLNVYGVQQRLALMGMDVPRTGVMDAKTVAALKIVQQQAGAYPYGGLDYCTLGIVKDMFDAWISPSGEDACLAKALDLLK